MKAKRLVLKQDCDKVLFIKSFLKNDDQKNPVNGLVVLKASHAFFLSHIVSGKKKIEVLVIGALQ